MYLKISVSTSLNQNHTIETLDLLHCGQEKELILLPGLIDCAKVIFARIIASRVAQFIHKLGYYRAL